MVFFRAIILKNKDSCNKNMAETYKLVIPRAHPNLPNEIFAIPKQVLYNYRSWSENLKWVGDISLDTESHFKEHEGSQNRSMRLVNTIESIPYHEIESRLKTAFTFEGTSLSLDFKKLMKDSKIVEYFWNQEQFNGQLYLARFSETKGSVIKSNYSFVILADEKKGAPNIKLDRARWMNITQDNGSSEINHGFPLELEFLLDLGWHLEEIKEIGYVQGLERINTKAPISWIHNPLDPKEFFKRQPSSRYSAHE